MALAGIEEIVVKEFGSELAGETVGWLRTREVEESDLVVASIAYARIGEDGARYTYGINEDGRQVTWSDAVTGFEESTELTIWGRVGEMSIANMQATKSPGQEAYRKTHPASKNTGFANTFYPDQGTPVETDSWTVGNDATIEYLKYELGALGVDWLYPHIYYNLAQMCPPDMQLVDPAQEPTTQMEQRLLKSYRDSLAYINLLDENMLRDLTIFGSAPADKIPDVFEQSRRAARTSSNQATASAEVMYSRGWLLGMRDVLTWPYMDPEQTDPWKAYGIELAQLKKEQIDAAEGSLRREVAAIEKRLEAAAAVSGKLTMLHFNEMERL